MVERLEIAVGPGRPHGDRRLESLSIQSLAGDVGKRHALVDIRRIAVGLQKQATIWKYHLTVSENIPKIVKPIGVPIDIL